ncbi:transketolase family protein [Candidatus Sumerlaeota bacterium]|nr:transketolase family protein [Candidatus Sumerlaeota bacterium]
MTEASLAPRDVVGQVLVDLGEKDPDVVVLDADFGPCSRVAEFGERFPERFVQVGIAEQNMMGIAAGLATTGMKPFASAIAAFCSRRACDQVTTSIALANLNVKILAVYPGLFVGKNGASHQSLEDIGIMRSIANMAVVQPADAEEMKAILRYAATHVGPMYVRVGRDPVPVAVPEGYEFELGRSVQLRDGDDIALIAVGESVEDAMRAAESLAGRGVEARVINMSSIKPLDEEAVVRAAREIGRIVTVENHNILGGLGSAVCETVAERCPVPVRRIGVRDVFGKSGGNDEMKAHFGIDAPHIEKLALDFLKE